MIQIEKKPKACRSCGGKMMISEVIHAKKKATFEHIIFRCRTCGAWCGGYTKPKNKGQ